MTAISFCNPLNHFTDEFKTDCLLWMLFNRSNLTASANGLEWNGKQWSLVNHFIPFTEAEVGALPTALSPTSWCSTWRTNLVARGASRAGCGAHAVANLLCPYRCAFSA
jgi:hypothetical protein